MTSSSCCRLELEHIASGPSCFGAWQRGRRTIYRTCIHSTSQSLGSSRATLMSDDSEVEILIFRTDGLIKFRAAVSHSLQRCTAALQLLHSGQKERPRGAGDSRTPMNLDKKTWPWQRISASSRRLVLGLQLIPILASSYLAVGSETVRN